MMCRSFHAHMKKSSPFILMLLVCLPVAVLCQQFQEVKRYQLTEAKQAVAVDHLFFYVVNNSTIVKYDKSSGREMARWDGSALGIQHLNSGIVIKGKLYCANSNYPHSPMAGSIEVFDPATMTHTGTHSFGISHGSATWIDEYQGFWYVGFANYTGKGSSEGRDHQWTSLVKYTKDWQEVSSWMFPENILALFAPKSNSGGSFGKDGLIYCTGHDRPEAYVMRLPDLGFTLKHEKTFRTASFGQGFALDKSERDKVIMYGLSRGDNAVIVSELR